MVESNSGFKLGLIPGPAGFECSPWPCCRNYYSMLTDTNNHSIKFIFVFIGKVNIQ